MWLRGGQLHFLGRNHAAQRLERFLLLRRPDRLASSTLAQCDYPAPGSTCWTRPEHRNSHVVLLKFFRRAGGLFFYEATCLLEA